MTPKLHLAQRTRDAHRMFTYRPDHARWADWIEQLAADSFKTPGEMLIAGAGDCDDFAVWTLQTAYEDTAKAHGQPVGDWRLVLGVVVDKGVELGHAWCELLDAGERWWSDPTWGLGPDRPAWLGFPGSRRPVRLFRFDGTLYQPLDVELIA